MHQAHLINTIICSLLASSSGFSFQKTKELDRKKMRTPSSHPSELRVVSKASDDLTDGGSIASRRSFFNIIGAAAATSSLAFITANDPVLAEEIAPVEAKKVLVLGGSGMVGSEVVRQLKEAGIEVVSTSTNGRGDTVALDFSTLNASELSATVKSLAEGCFAVISCVGSIGTENDLAVNSGTGLVAQALKGSTVKNFVYVSVAPEVRDFAKDIDFLKPYMEGKASSESAVENFGGKATLIKPTFIYGGDEFKLNPPRVASGYGKLVEGLLSQGPFRFAADVFPGFISIALEPPVNVVDVAGAAVSALKSDAGILDTHDKIVQAARL